MSRARELGGGHPAAADLLAFYAALAGYQKTLAEKTPDSFFPAAADAIPDFLAWLQREPTSPAPLAEAAATYGGLDRLEWRAVMDSLLPIPESLAPNPEPRLPTPDPMLFIVEAVLQPFAGEAADTCPFCAGPPVLGVLREEGQGARRGLVCALCLEERDYRRVICPGCREERFESLPVYTSDEIAHVRLDACDTCRCYLKTIDLTKDGLAVPVVDDLATVALDLWAREQGYTRLRANILRV